MTVSETTKSKKPLRRAAYVYQGDDHSTLIFSLATQDSAVLNRLIRHFVEIGTYSKQCSRDGRICLLVDTTIQDLAAKNDVSITTGLHYGCIYIDNDEMLYYVRRLDGDNKICEIVFKYMHSLHFNILTPICNIFGNPSKASHILDLDPVIISNEARREAYDRLQNWLKNNANVHLMQGTIYMNGKHNVFVRVDFDNVDPNYNAIVELFEGWKPSASSVTEPAKNDSGSSCTLILDTKPKLDSRDEETFCDLLLECLNRKNLLHFHFLMTAFQVEKQPGLPRRLALEMVTSRYSSNPSLKAQFELLINNSNNKTLVELLSTFS